MNYSNLQGIEGDFQSPIHGDVNKYSLRIYESLVTDKLLDNLTVFDENERCKLYVGNRNIIVIKGK